MAYTPPTKICPQCEVKFYAPNGLMKFCSSKCKEFYWNNKRRIAEGIKNRFKVLDAEKEFKKNRKTNKFKPEPLLKELMEQDMLNKAGKSLPPYPEYIIYMDYTHELIIHDICKEKGITPERFAKDCMLVEIEKWIKNKINNK